MCAKTKSLEKWEIYNLLHLIFIGICIWINFQFLLSIAFFFFLGWCSTLCNSINLLYVGCFLFPSQTCTLFFFRVHHSPLHLFWCAIWKQVISSSNIEKIFLSQFWGVQWAINLQTLHWTSPDCALGPVPCLSLILTKLSSILHTTHVGLLP